MMIDIAIWQRPRWLHACIVMIEIHCSRVIYNYVQVCMTELLQRNARTMNLNFGQFHSLDQSPLFFPHINNNNNNNSNSTICKDLKDSGIHSPPSSHQLVPDRPTALSGHRSSAQSTTMGVVNNGGGGGGSGSNTVARKETSSSSGSGSSHGHQHHHQHQQQVGATIKAESNSSCR